MRWWIAVAVAGVMALGGVAWWFARPEAAPTVPIPEPPQFGTHGDPMVDRFLRSVLAEALAAPGDSRLRGQLAMAYDANGCTALAEETYGQAMMMNRTEAQWPYLRGVLRAGEGMDGAMADFDEAVRRAPNSPTVHWQRGYAHLDDGSIALAEADFARALTLSDTNAAAMTGLARVRMEQDQDHQAIQLLERVLHLHPSAERFVPYVHGLLGTAYRRTGDIAAAQRHLGRQAGGRPSWPDDWYSERSGLSRKLERVLARAQATIAAGQVEQGIAMIEELRSFYPDNTALIIALHAAHASRGDIPTAMNLLERVPVNSADYAVARMNMAILTMRAEQYDQSMVHIRAALQRQPSLSRAHEHHAKLLTLKNDWTGAADALELAFRFGLNDEASRILAGRVCLNANRIPEAAEYFNAVLQRNPDNVSAWAGMALAQVALRRHDRAEAAVRNAQRLGVTDPTDQQLLDMARNALRPNR